MEEDRREKLMREAAEIFFELRDAPDNSRLKKKRDAFVARGPEEKAAYEHLLKTWKASGVMRAPKVLRTTILVCLGLTGALALAYDPVRIAILADLSTRMTPEQSTLSSGDIAFLDADTALIDDTDGIGRRVEILAGAAFFDVKSSSRPFTVAAGDVTVTVVGTAFETGFIGGAVLVSVAEGQVDVRLDDQVWELAAGDEFKWSHHIGVVFEQRETSAMASWRADRLVVDGLTFGQAADIIERRLSGAVVFTDASLRNTPVAGNVDLAQPLRALRLLADLSGGRVYHIPGVGRVISNRW